MSNVPVPERRNSADSLENFARSIEEMFRKGKDQGPLALKRQVCRLLASKNPQVAATMTSKWVDWRYGKTLKVEGTITHEHIDLSNLSDEQLATADKLIDSALEALGHKG